MVKPSVPPKNQPPGASQTPPATWVTHAYVERELKVYAVLESEVKTFAMFNSISTGCFSVGAGLVSLAGGIWTNAAFVTDQTAAGEILSGVVAPVLCSLSAIFFFAGMYARTMRGDALEAIKRESKQS